MGSRTPPPVIGGRHPEPRILLTPDPSLCTVQYSSQYNPLPECFCIDICTTENVVLRTRRRIIFVGRKESPARYDEVLLHCAVLMQGTLAHSNIPQPNIPYIHNHGTGACPGTRRNCRRPHVRRQEYQYPTSGITTAQYTQRSIIIIISMPSISSILSILSVYLLVLRALGFFTSSFTSSTSTSSPTAFRLLCC